MLFTFDIEIQGHINSKTVGLRDVDVGCLIYRVNYRDAWHVHVESSLCQLAEDEGDVVERRRRDRQTLIR
jgi:hypothetical protein